MGPSTAVNERQCLSGFRLFRTASVSLRVSPVAALPMMAVTLRTRPRSANDGSHRPEMPTWLRQFQEGNTPVRTRRGSPGGATCSRRRKRGRWRARSARARTSSSTTTRASVGPTSTRGSSTASLHAACGRGRIGAVPTARRVPSTSDSRSVARALARCQPAGSFTRRRSLRSTYVRASAGIRGSTDSDTTERSPAATSCAERSSGRGDAAGSESPLDPQPTSAPTSTNTRRMRAITLPRAAGAS